MAVEDDSVQLDDSVELDDAICEISDCLKFIVSCHSESIIMNHVIIKSIDEGILYTSCVKYISNRKETIAPIINIVDLKLLNIGR